MPGAHTATIGLFFPSCVFLCFPMPLMPPMALRRLADDSDSDVIQ